MRHLHLILLFLISYSFAFGQEKKESFWMPYVISDIHRLNLISFDSLNCQIAFRIWNSNQVIELIKVNDSIYTGQLVNYVTKMTRKQKSIRTISQKLKIPNYKVRLLIEKLLAENIETLPDSDEVKDYINGLDGTTIIFEIFSNKMSRIYTYWEPENDYYQDSNLNEVRNVRNILKAIKEQVDLERLFTNFENNLEPGTYALDGIIMTIK